jgi:hypothetical protein
MGGRAAQNVLRKESEGEVTQGETEGFDRSDRVLLGEPKMNRPGLSPAFLYTLLRLYHPKPNHGKILLRPDKRCRAASEAAQ